MFGKKFLKSRRLKNKGFCYKCSHLIHGDFGLKSKSWGRVTAKQIESGRKVISRHIKKGGKLWIMIFPDISFTKKPIDVRMGNGKGEIIYYFFNVSPGRIIYEISGISRALSLKILRLASFKLSIKSTIIMKKI